jgi:hypothetical protein
MPKSEFEEWARLSGLSHTNALEAINSPDQTERKEYDGVVLHGYTKCIARAKPPIVVLAITSTLPNRSTEPWIVLKVYQSFRDSVTDLPPFTLLAEILDSFGVPLAFGPDPKRLFLCESIPVPRPITGIEPPKGHTLIAQLMRFVAPESRYSCALACAVDVQAYQAYLRDAKRMTN